MRLPFVTSSSGSRPPEIGPTVKPASFFPTLSLDGFKTVANETANVLLQGGNAVRTYWQKSAPTRTFLLASFHMNEKNFAPRDLLTIGGYATVYWFCANSGIAQPVNMVNMLDSVGTSAVELAQTAYQGDPEFKPSYFTGFADNLGVVVKCNASNKEDVPGVNCYSVGGSYISEARKDPDYSRLWGDVFKDLSAPETAFFLSLFGAGLTLAYMAQNRKEISALYRDFKDTGDLQKQGKFEEAVVVNERIKEGELSLSKKGAAAAAVGVAILGLMETGLDHDTAVFLARAAVVSGGTYITTKLIRNRMFKAEGYPNTLGPVGTVLAGSIFCLVLPTLFRMMSDSAGMHQFEAGATNSIWENWLDWKSPSANWDLLTAFFFVVALEQHMNSRFTRLSVNLTNHSLGKYFGMDRNKVNGALLQFSDSEKAGINAGLTSAHPVSRALSWLIILGFGAGIVNNGIAGIQDLIAGQSRNPFWDTTFAAASAALVGGAIEAWRNPQGKIRHGFDVFKSGIATWLKGPRLAYLGLLTVFNGTTNGMTTVASQFAQGYSNEDNYYLFMGTRNYYTSLPSRIYEGIMRSVRAMPISQAEYLLPSYLTVLAPLMAQKQTAQTPTNNWIYEASTAALSNDPESVDAAIKEMARIEAKLWASADIKGNGNHDPEIMQVAKNNLASIKKLKVTYGFNVDDEIP